MAEAISKANRIHQLEGLRGLAALSVVFSHLVLTFIPVLWITDQSLLVRQSLWVTVLTSTPLRIVFDGALAVKLFFVHSGFVLSYQFFAGSKTHKAIMSASIRRYFRLTGPLAASVFFAYLLMVLGLMANSKFASVLPQVSWLGKFYKFDPNFFEAARQAFYGSYFQFNPATTYNTVLWTISVELFGSYLVYASLAMFGFLRRRFICYIALGFVTIRSDLFVFVVGMALCDFWVNRASQWVAALTQKNRHLLGWGLFILGLYLGPYRTTQFTLWQILSFLPPSFLNQVQLIGACCLFFSAIILVPFASLLQTKPVRFLGELCYSVYVFHLPILCSVGSLLGIYYVTNLGSDLSTTAWMVSLFTVVTTLALSVWATRFIDKPSINLGHWIFNRYFLPKNEYENQQSKAG